MFVVERVRLQTNKAADRRPSILLFLVLPVLLLALLCPWSYPIRHHDKGHIDRLPTSTPAQANALIKHNPTARLYVIFPKTGDLIPD
jgi:hypothetical protein